MQSLGIVTEKFKLENEAKNEEIEIETEFEKHYFFSPSISKRKTINGKSYIVRSYFAGDKDFNETVIRLAQKQAYKHTR